MLIYEYKLDAKKEQYAAIDNAIRTVQFIRNKCIRLWMDERGISQNDLQLYCAVLAREFSFAGNLNSQARQVSADRAWVSISRFYDNCKAHKPGKKGYPKFQHDNRSVEYKATGWKLEPDGKHITKLHLKVQRQREDFAQSPHSSHPSTVGHTGTGVLSGRTTLLDSPASACC